jgi:hypothetical protein
MDFVRAVLQKDREEDRDSAPDEPKVLWIQFEEARPRRVWELLEDLNEAEAGSEKRVISVRTLDLAEFLREVHTRLANAHTRSLRY